MIAVVAFDDLGEVEPVVAALERGGPSCVEIAFRTDIAAAASELAKASRSLMVGAGTVLDERPGRGGCADFAVAPGLNEQVVGRA